MVWGQAWDSVASLKKKEKKWTNQVNSGFSSFLILCVPWMTHTMSAYEVRIRFMRICPRKLAQSLAELEVARDKDPGCCATCHMPWKLTRHQEDGD